MALPEHTWTLTPPRQFSVAAPVRAHAAPCTPARSSSAQLSYAAGSPIPVLCTLSCADAHALDVLAPSPALGLHLARTLAFGSTAAIPAAHQRHTIFTENTAKARWWPAPDRKPQPGVRHLAGEIQVRKGVKPSFVFPRLSVYVGPALDARSAAAHPVR
jgi:hypothetical protein